MGVVTGGEDDGAAGNAQFLATAGIFHVADGVGAVHVHVGDKAVGAGDKAARTHGFIDHKITSFGVDYSIIGEGEQEGAKLV